MTATLHRSRRGVFKIERGPAGDRIAYTRLFAGTLRVRDRFDAGRVTELRVFADGDAVQRDSAHAGEIAKLWGLGEIQTDWLGESHRGAAHHFAPPTFEAVVEAADPAEGQRLRVALGQLAEQDPLIDVRQDDTRSEISVSLYGEVQREVIESTLADEYGVAVAFRETTTICIERPTGSGEAVEILNTPTNPFHADLGLRVEPAAPGSGVEVRVSGEIDPRDAPLYVFKTFDAFAEHMDEYVQLALEEGLRGWQVTDCVVTVTKIGYSLADGPPSRRGPMPTARDLKRLVPRCAPCCGRSSGADPPSASPSSGSPPRCRPRRSARCSRRWAALAPGEERRHRWESWRHSRRSCRRHASRSCVGSFPA